MFSIIAIFLAMYLYRSVKRQEAGNERMVFIAKAIQSGAMSFLKREYVFLSFFVVFFSVIFAFLPGYGVTALISFLIGSLLPAVSGYVGMKIATIANVRTTQAALTKGEKGAFLVAFRGGSVMGLVTTGLALFGTYQVLGLAEGNLNILIAFGFGAGLIGLFGRVGGGIFTKAADVGADLVGKIEAGIPEDDPRNPAVIADNVGDNVGDIAGMGADIFGSYINALIAAMVIAYTIPNLEYDGVLYAFTIGMTGMFASILTIIFLPRLRLNTGLILRIAPILSSVITLVVMFIWNDNFNLAFSAGDWYFPFAPFTIVLIGTLGGTLVGLITEWYTAGKPVRNIADASKSGHGSNVIHGLSVGMESTIFPLIIVCAMTYLSFMLMGSYGIALAAVAMLSNLAITMTIDAYGPIADNAGGIAEMAHLDPEVRKITDKLDAYGNTTAAMGKGFAIAAAVLTAMALLSAFMRALPESITIIGLSDPFTVIGLFIGGMLTFVFSSMTMRAVGNTAIKMVEEVRRQFKEIPGLMEGKTDPDYKTCVEISTNAALKKMLAPGIIAIAVPVFAFFAFGDTSYKVIAGIIVGSLITGSFMALFMANAGGAWDNAKKYIESGQLEGHLKGSDAHKAAVTGDTVGDPFKDTSGPSLNILIKLVATIALILAPFIG